MRVWICLAVAIVFLGGVAQAGQLKPWQTRAVALAKAEKKIHDAMWSQSISFWITMTDDGSNRDGYAEYLCFVLRDAGKPKGEIIIVSVWDQAGMRVGNPSRIGRAGCR